MQIDLNNDSEFTEENVGKLIGSVIDDQHWQLRVTNEGIAFLSEKAGNLDTEGIAFRYETWCAKNNYVGFQAQHDKEWVKRIYNSLKQNWPNPNDTFIDDF